MPRRTVRFLGILFAVASSSHALAAQAICYQATLQGGILVPEVCNNAQAGTTGRSMRMEAIKIRLQEFPGLRVCYQAHVQNKGWMPEVCDNAQAGVVGQGLRMEAIKIRLVGTPGWSVCYQSYVENKGWMPEVRSE